MARNTARRQGRVFSGIAVLGTLAVAGVSFAFQGDARPGDEMKHLIVLPPVQPTAASNCSNEAAAYAQALVDLEAAQNSANEAYNAWYACESGGKPVQASETLSAKYSVLIRE